MIKFMYAFYDKLGNVYADPICSINDEVARRDFHVACMNKDSLIYKFPTDYALFRIGEYDTKSGMLNAYEPVVVCRGTDFVEGE